MRGMGSWGAALLGVGLAASVAAAQQADTDGGGTPRGLLSGLFHEKPIARKKAIKVERTSPTTAAPPAQAANPEPASNVERAIAEQQRQMNAILRRMEVCDRLREIALQTGNDILIRRADDLEARARDIYKQQTARLPIPYRTRSLPTKTDEMGLTGEPAADSLELARTSQTPKSTGRGDNFQQRQPNTFNGTSMGRERP